MSTVASQPGGPAPREGSSAAAPDGERRRAPGQMLRHKILIVSTDARMRRALNRLMTATGASTEFVTDLARVPAEPPSLILVDLRTAAAGTLAQLERLFPDVRLMCLTRSGDFPQITECLERPRCGNVIAYEEHFDPADFIISVTKLLHGQVFGLQKYFPWGVTLYHMDVHSYQEKGRAIEVLNAYAELAGARGPVRDRITRVAEELIMNALYHAPVDEQGRRRFENVPRKELAQVQFDPPVRVACASNGELFAVAVRDEHGSLDKETVVRFLKKGVLATQTPEQRESGAGLGLVTSLKHSSRLVFNLAPGVATEVIALFDIEPGGRQQAGLRSVHVFTERRRQAAEVAAAHPGGVPDLVPAARPAGEGSGSLVAVLSGALAMAALFVVLALVRPDWLSEAMSRISRAGGAAAPVSAQLSLQDGETRELPLKVNSGELRLHVERRGSKLVIRAPGGGPPAAPLPRE